MKNIVLLVLSTFIIQFGYAEGIKQLAPDTTAGVQLRFNYDPDPNSSDGGPFATPVAPPEYRLYVTAAAAGEKIYFGFQASSTGILFCVKDSLGNVVYPSGGTPIAVPTTGNGYIKYYKHANNGPKTLNAGGYNDLSFSAPFAGNFYFEFSWTSASGNKMMKLWDITVADASNVVQPGRVWSKNWQMQTQTNSTQFKGTMYPYTDDRITTSINFNGMAPARFTVACNPTGVAATGNFTTDRKSVTGNHTYPAYKIFVNDPDIDIFPSGIMGGVDSVTTDNACDGTLNINLYVNKKGYADIVLNINPLPGIQAEDVILSGEVYSGTSTTIPWNGINGLGDLVPSGTPVSIEVTYINGLTHLPMYDVEYSQQSGNNWQGFIVNLVRPTGAKPKVFWDDTDPSINNGSNLAGCTTPTGCHTWGYSAGNENTINTWWFALSTTLLPLNIIYKRSEFYAHTNTICDGDSILLAGEYRLLPGAYYDSSLNIMNCDSVHQYNLIVNPRPIVDLGADAFICQGETLTLDAGIGAGQTYLWNTGATSSQITVSTTNTYTVTVNNPHNCPISDSKYVYVSPPPPGVLIKHN